MATQTLRRRAPAMALLIGSVLLAAGPESAHAQNARAHIGPSGEVTSGQQQFRRYCAQCHGLDATGDGPVAPALKKKPTNLTTLTKDNGGVFPEKEVADYINGNKMVASHGTREMPIWGREFMLRQSGAAGAGAPTLTPTQVKQKIALLVGYIKSIQVQ